MLIWFQNKFTILCDSKSDSHCPRQITRVGTQWYLVQIENNEISTLRVATHPCEEVNSTDSFISKSFALFFPYKMTISFESIVNPSLSWHFALS